MLGILTPFSFTGKPSGDLDDEDVVVAELVDNENELSLVLSILTNSS